MAASIGWYEADGTTAASAPDLGAVPPGESYYGRNGAYVELRVKNDGDVAFSTVAVEIQQRSFHAAYQYLQIATGATPGAFQDYAAGGLAVAATGVGAAAELWLDAVVPSGAAATGGQAASLVALATI